MPSEFSDLIQSRYSVRDFRPEPVSDEVLEAILDDARHAPSWSNTRPYCLALATGERLERMRAAYGKAFEASLGMQRREPGAILKAILLRRGLPDPDFATWKSYPEALRRRSIKMGKAFYEHLGIARGDRAAREAAMSRNTEFFGAPAVVWLFIHRDMLPFSAHDGGLMLQTLMLAAKAHGVDSCALGMLANWRHPVEAEFIIPKRYRLITGLALGYASDHPINEFRAERPPVHLLEAQDADLKAG